MRFLWMSLLLVTMAGCATHQNVPVVSGGQKEPVYQSGNSINNGNGVIIKPQEDREALQAKTIHSSKPIHDTKLGVVKLLASAESYSLKRKYAKAQSVLERAQRIDPKEPKVYYELAVIHLKKNQPRQAEQLCKKGLSLSHGNPILQKELWIAMAKALDAQGKKQKAQRALQRAYQIKV
ncbi:tetratricopeptide repeat protein [Litoribrevibacter euphylliae]|uniref:Tetratricopeptide repeat protein n=1 Tax=Litoribrevibacter euphylliae TaxID=1834034 RepID=A0ABV7HIG9_9GAMM